MDGVQEAILQGMLRGELEPGTWIRQDDLADRLGVSKIPVREALQRLVARGLLRAERNRGIVVPELSADDAEENFGLRRAIEPELLRRAVPRMAGEDLAEAERALGGEGLTPTEANWVFHRALSRASGWQRGIALCEVLHAAVAPYVLLYTEKLGWASRSHRQHLEMLEACRAGDAELATATLQRHLDEAATALVEFLGGRDSFDEGVGNPPRRSS